MSGRHPKACTGNAVLVRSVGRIGVLVAALLVSVTMTAVAGADVSFIKAYGWGVSDGAHQFEVCTTTCHGGIGGAGAGEFESPAAVATDSSGDVYVADEYNSRIDEFSSAGAFIKAYGWGVLDGADQFETCTTTCQTGIGENTAGTDGVGELFDPTGVATNSSGDVYVADDDATISEFSSAGAFIKAYGWGVLDGADQFETCTTTCEGGIAGSGAGQFDDPVSVATDSSGGVYVADEGNDRIDEFSAAGAFVKAYGWGVVDGASHFETCTTVCEGGIAGSGAGQLYTPTGVGTDPSGDVYVADDGNNRIDEFSASGAFIKAYGWGVVDGGSRFETCATTCDAGIGGGPEGDGDGAGGAGALFDPWGVATDSSGDVYVADLGNQRIDEFSATGAFIAAYGWGVADGASNFETCTTTCQAGPFDEGDGFENPTDVAIDPSGDVSVADYASNRIDEFSVAGAATCASAPSIATQPAAQTVTAPAAATFTAAGSTPANCSVPGVQWSSEAPGATSFSPISGATSTSYTTPATTTAQSRTKYEATFTNAVGSTTTSTATLTVVNAAGAPSNDAPPAIAGKLEAGKMLSCSAGSWTNDPTEFAFHWIRNGTTLDGATGDTYTLGTLDEGTTLTCIVTAINAAGHASASSKGVKVPIPYVRLCPAATGTMTGTTIGQITLGLTRGRARYLYRRHSNRGKQYEDFFCLTPIGVRVGYASPILLKGLSRSEQAKVRGRVVWASVSNPYYSLDRIRAGESIATASLGLGTEPPFHIGLNYWYLARKATYTAVLKVRGGVVEELGIADNALTTSRSLQRTLMHSFY